MVPGANMQVPDPAEVSPGRFSVNALFGLLMGLFEFGVCFKLNRPTAWRGPLSNTPGHA